MNPIKIVVTADTQEAAAALRKFLADTGNGLDEVTKKAAHAGGALGQNKFALMELGHSARATAESLAFGMSPLKVMALEAPRVVQAFTMMNEAMKASVIAMLPALGGVAVALGAGAIAWKMYGESFIDPTRRARDMADALEKIPGILLKIQTAQLAGSISPDQAQKYRDLLSGATPLYNQRTVRDAYGGHASTIGTGIMGLTGEQEVQLTTEQNIRNSRTGQVIGQRDRANTADVSRYVEQQMKKDKTTGANEKSQPGDEALVKLHEEELKIQRDAELGTQKAIDRIKDRYELERRSIAQHRDDTIATQRWSAGEEANYQKTLKDSKAAEAASIAELQSKAEEERVRKQGEAVKVAEEEKKKIVLDQEKDLNTALEAYANATTTKTKEYWDNVYEAKTTAAQRAYDVDEDAVALQKRLADAQKEHLTGYKEVTAEIERRAQLEQSVARTRAEVDLKRISSNPFLNAQDKQQLSIPAITNLQAENNRDIATNQGIAGDSKTSDTARLEALKQVNELTLKQIDLQNQLDAAENANSFNYQLSETITRLQNIGTVAQQSAQAFGAIWNTSVNSISHSISGLVEGTMSWGQAMRNIYNSIVNEIVQQIVHMAVQWVLQHTLMSAISSLFHAGETAKQAAATTAQTGIHTAGEAAKTGATAAGAGARGGIGVMETVWHGLQTGIRTAIHFAGQLAMTAATLAASLIRHAIAFLEMQPYIILAGIEAASAVAGIPFVGPILAPIAAATTIAGLEALAAFDEGGYTGNGGRLEPAGVVHRGEFVMSAPAVQRIGLANLEAMHNGATGGGGGGKAGGGTSPAGNTVSIHAHLDQQLMRNALEQDPNHEQWVLDIMRRNAYRHS